MYVRCNAVRRVYECRTREMLTKRTIKSVENHRGLQRRRATDRNVGDGGREDVIDEIRDERIRGSQGRILKGE